MMDYCLSYDSSTGGVSLRGVGDVYQAGDVVSDVKWNIIAQNGGYIFQHYNHSTRTMYPTGSGTAVGTPITTGSYSGSNSTFRWTLEDGGAPMGTLLHDTANGTLANQSTVRYVECGQTVSLSRLNLMASYYADWEYCFVPSWSSSNTSVASVNASTGQITAHAPGTATITLTMLEDYSGEEFICRYTLVVPEEVYDQFVRIEIGEVKTPEELGLSEFIDQANPTDQTLTWDSSNEAIADVDSEGNVTAVSCGEVTITATASGSTILAYTLRVCRYANLLITNHSNFSAINFEQKTKLTPYGAATYLSMINTNVEQLKPDKGFSKNKMIEYLKCASVVYIVAHGQYNGIIIEEPSKTMLTMDDLTGVDLSNLDLVVLLSCETAKGEYSESNVTNNTPSNFMEQLRCCGVKTVVAFDEMVTYTQFAVFAAELTRLIVGKSNKLNEVTNEYDDIPKLTVYGAINQMKNGGDPSLLYSIVNHAFVGPVEEDTAQNN